MINKKGLSLIEIIVSIALISTITLFMYRLLADITFQKNNEFFASKNQETKIEIEEYVHNRYISTVKEIDGCSDKECVLTTNDDTRKTKFTLTKIDNDWYLQIKLNNTVIKAWKLEQAVDVKFERKGNTISILIFTDNYDNNSNNNNTLDDIFLYFDPAGVDDYAMFKKGSQVRSSMLTLAGNSSLIKNFVYSVEPPNEVFEELALKVSVEDSPLEILMWYTDNTIYYYSEATTVYLHDDSSNMFSGFSNLSNISGVTHFNTSKTTNMASMFQNTAIKNTDNLASFDMSNVHSISAMFSGCKSLTSYQGLKDWDTRYLEFMDSAFAYNEKITSIKDLENWNVERVHDINDAFYAMKKLSSLDGLEKWKIGKYHYNNQQNGKAYAVVFIGGAFRGPNQVKTLEPLRAWKTYSTVFGGMASLSNLTDPDCKAIQDSGETKQPITKCYFGAFQNLNLDAGGADAISDWYFIERNTTCNKTSKESKAFINMFKDTNVRPTTIHLFKEAHYGSNELYTITSITNVYNECRANMANPGTYCIKKTTLNNNGSLITGINTKC